MTDRSDRRLRDRLAQIRETLHPTRETYCAEPIDIEDARWLLRLVEAALAELREYSALADRRARREDD